MGHWMRTKGWFEEMRHLDRDRDLHVRSHLGGNVKTVKNGYVIMHQDRNAKVCPVAPGVPPMLLSNNVIEEKGLEIEG